MPIGTCEASSRGDAYNSVALERRGVLVDIHYGWDGVSAMPDCDGPVSFIRTRNTGAQPAWANLPLKKRGDTWIRIDPGTDVTITAAGQLRNIGLEKYSDAAIVALTWVQPV